MPNFVESLETRLAMSVSGVSLGNFNTGTTLTWATTSNGQSTGTTTSTVTGPKTVNKVKTIAETDTTTSGGTTSTAVAYDIVSPTDGQLIYRIDGASKQGSTTTHTSTTFSNPKAQALFPKTLVAGKTYSYAWTRTDTTVVGHHTPTSNVYATTFTVKLRSNKSRKITTPAGTFHCYTIDEVTTFKIDGQSETISSTDYVTPGVGIIEQANVSVTSVSPKQKTTSTIILQSFKLT